MENIVVQHQCRLGEGPVWDHRCKTIRWIDILGGEIHSYSPADREMKSITVHQMIGSVALCKNGDFIAALENGFGFIDRNLGTVRMIADPEAHLSGNRFNDGKVDPAGRFWAGTMSHEEAPDKGSLYMLGADLNVTKKIQNISVSNGLAWSADYKTFYYTDSPTRMVAAYDYDKMSGSISNRRIVLEIPEQDGWPDGMTIDQEGNLWIAHWDGWQIARWNPQTGRKLSSIRLPVARVSSCCFGGDDFQDLYVTTAKKGLTEEQLKEQPLAGSLFVIRNIGYQGCPAFEFGE